jgi:hypothetical protein
MGSASVSQLVAGFPYQSVLSAAWAVVAAASRRARRRRDFMVKAEE